MTARSWRSPFLRTGLVGSAGLVLGATTYGAVVTLRTPDKPHAPVASVESAAERATAADFVPCARSGLDDDDYAGAPWRPPGVEIVSIEHWNGREFVSLRSRPSSGIAAPATPGETGTITPDGDEKEWDHPLPYQIEVGDGPSAELMTVVARTGNTLTVQRSGNATAHTDGARVTYCPRLQRVHLRALNPVPGQRPDAVVALRGPMYPTLGHGEGAVVEHPAGGHAVSDVVTLEGAGDSPTGTITFTLYGPNPAGCDTPLVPPIEVPVTGNGPYSPPPAALPDPTTLIVAGYRWTAEYSGDSANDGWRTSCNDTRQNATQPKAQPLLVANGPVVGVVGQPLTIPVNLQRASGPHPAGSIEVRLYDPDDTACTGGALTTSTPVRGNATHTSGRYVPTRVGSWRWTANWSGDVNNEPATAACNGTDQEVTVAKATPVLSVVSPQAGLQLTATVPALGPAFSPTGLAHFKIFNGNACAGTELAPESVDPISDLPPTSAPFAAPAPGTYSWQVHYDGDANNTEVTVCQPVVARYPTALTLTTAVAPPGNMVSAAVSQVTGGVNPTGFVRFRLFQGPACVGNPLSPESADPVTDAPPTSATYGVLATGTYSWQARYDGDATNAPATACRPVTVATVPATPTPVPTPRPTPGPYPSPLPAGTHPTPSPRPSPSAPVPSPTLRPVATPAPSPRGLP